MKAKVNAKDFIQALDKVSGLIRKSFIPALEAVLVRFEDNHCTLTSTNLESWLSMEVFAQCDDFAFLRGRPRETARAFRQFDGELVLEQTETGEGSKRKICLTLSCGSRSAELFPFLPEDFPEQPKWEPRHAFTANAAELHARVERVRYAAGSPGQEHHRAFQSSIQFSGRNIYTVDGYRLSCDADPELTVPVPFMASPQTLGHLKLFGDHRVTFRLGQLFATVTDGVTALTFRMPEGELFKLHSAVPDSFQTEFDVSPKELLNELDYLKRSLRGNIRHMVRFSNGGLFASSHGERYASRVQADGNTDVTFGFDLSYMADALKQFEKEPAVRMKLNSPHGPLVIEADGRNDFALVTLARIRDGAAAA